MCFSENRSVDKIHKMCFSENWSDEISEKCARPADQRKIVGFCIKCVLQGGAFCEIRQFTTMKMSHFDEMTKFSPSTHFLCKTRFVRKYCFQGVRYLCVHIFVSDTKKFAKNPEMCTRDCRPVKSCRFLCTLHSSGERSMRNSVIHDDENIVFWQNVRIFPENV